MWRPLVERWRAQAVTAAQFANDHENLFAAGEAARLQQCADDLEEAARLVVGEAPQEEQVCQGTINGYVGCELPHGHKGPCNFKPVGEAGPPSPEQAKHSDNAGK